MKKLILLSAILAAVTNAAAQTPTTDPGVNINGTIWATRNVAAPGTFADKPEDAGMFYQWGSNVGWSSADPLTATDGNNTWRDLAASSDTWLPENDPCPSGWRVPAMFELEEMEGTHADWDTLNNVHGRFYGSGSNTIFLPAAGSRETSEGGLENNDPYWGGRGGRYWSSTNRSGSGYVYMLAFTEGSTFIRSNENNGIQSRPGSRLWGYCVRCVKANNTAIPETPQQNGIHIFPNPVKDELIIESAGANGIRPENVEILDLSGKTVFLPSCGGAGGGFSINVSHLSAGIYLLKIETDKGTVTERFVKE
jgi:hypothetical protein